MSKNAIEFHWILSYCTEVRYLDHYKGESDCHGSPESHIGLYVVYIALSSSTSLANFWDQTLPIEHNTSCLLVLVSRMCGPSRHGHRVRSMVVFHASHWAVWAPKFHIGSVVFFVWFILVWVIQFHWLAFGVWLSHTHQREP